MSDEIDFDKGVQEIQEAQKQYKDLLESKSKQVLAAAFSKMFKADPRIERIEWSQYTPYFNDGDPCEFGVYDREFFGVGGAELSTYRGKGLAPAALAVDNQLDKLEDVFLAAFDDHKEIVVTLVDGAVHFEVSDSEHD